MLREKERFQVIEHAQNVWKIVDTEHKQWNMPEMAVSIYFGNQFRAMEITNYLNNEWRSFLRSPT